VLALERRIGGPLLRRAGIVVVAEIPGRRTGALRRVTLLPIEVQTTEYLVSQYGDVDWVRNLRSAGRARLHRPGRTDDMRAVEVQGDERDQAIAAYRAKMGWRRKDFDQLPDNADHPTFRIEPSG
jgi:deazaflavin-dependent oxidoreductase (nitroreductase family)